MDSEEVLFMIRAGRFANKALSVFLGVLICLCLVPARAQAAPPAVNARGAVLMDAASGRILWERNGDKRLPMASTTKIMTALVALKYGDPDEKIKVRANTTRIEGSSIWLEEGEVLTLTQLLYGLMLRSGNDAAETIAQAVAGDVDSFVDLMNRTARELGADDTHFVNPHGLPADDHYTTARDLAVITRAALEVPLFREIVACEHKVIPWRGHPYDRAMRNKNRLLWELPGCTGVKIGYTKQAGRCLSASAMRNGMELIAVVLDCPSYFETCAAILEYGFDEYRICRLYREGTPIMSLNVKRGFGDKTVCLAGGEFAMALSDSEWGELRTAMRCPSGVKAPIEAGQEVGTLDIYLREDKVGEMPLVARDTVEAKTLGVLLKMILRMYASPVWGDTDEV
jgi:D-alanyl-D-alanine carboxypeptidase (penicillin-binding protein 5/6)